MARVSNEAVLTRVEALHEKWDTFMENDYKPLKEESKLNTEFRLKAYGVFIAIGAIWTFIAGMGIWIYEKLRGGN